MRALDGRRVGGTVVKMALECRGGVLVWWNLFLTPAASYLGSKWFSGILGMRVSLCMDCCFFFWISLSVYVMAVVNRCRAR